MSSKGLRIQLEQLSGWTLPEDSAVAGYLLRKLPHGIYVYKKKTPKPRYGGVGRYTAQLSASPYRTNDDVPEDALCKLAIKLIKEGVIEI
jgi:hypothetical protein